jgi:hypothetical protein
MANIAGYDLEFSVFGTYMLAPGGGVLLTTNPRHAFSQDQAV